jgi:hypothetical protein
MTDYVIQIDNDPIICRICYEEDDINNMIHPCKCSGNMKYVHLNCLNTWRKTTITRNKQCEICYHNYIISIPYFNNFFEVYTHNSKSIQFIHIFTISILSAIFYGCDSNRTFATMIIGDTNNTIYFRIYYILSFIILFFINILIVSSNIYSLSTINKKMYFRSLIINNSYKYIFFFLILFIVILYYYTFYDDAIYIDIVYSILLSDIFNKTHIYNLKYIDNIDDEYILNYE